MSRRKGLVIIVDSEEMEAEGSFVRVRTGTAEGHFQQLIDESRIHHTLQQCPAGNAGPFVARGQASAVKCKAQNGSCSRVAVIISGERP